MEMNTLHGPTIILFSRRADLTQSAGRTAGRSRDRSLEQQRQKAIERRILRLNINWNVHSPLAAARVASSVPIRMIIALLFSFRRVPLSLEAPGSPALLSLTTNTEKAQKQKNTTLVKRKDDFYSWCKNCEFFPSRVTNEFKERAEDDEHKLRRTLTVSTLPTRNSRSQSPAL